MDDRRFELVKANQHKDRKSWTFKDGSKVDFDPPEPHTDNQTYIGSGSIPLVKEDEVVE